MNFRNVGWKRERETKGISEKQSGRERKREGEREREREREKEANIAIASLRGCL